MYRYSKKSQDMLNSCHPDIQKVFNEAIKYVDITILEGVREIKRQEELVKTGASTTMNSKHLKQSDGYSYAVDAVPYPVIWPDLKNKPKEYVKDMGRFYMFVGIILGVAYEMGVKLRVGADWNGNLDLNDQNFDDLPHFELVKP